MNTVALAEICDFASGGTPNRADESFYTGDVPWITGADIVGDRINPRSFITDSAIAGSAARIVPSGTVLLVTRTSVGKVAVADRDLSFSQDITALVPNEEKLQRRFLVHFLRSEQSYFNRNARGATIKGITRSVVRDLQIPYLPLSEQGRIAEILDKADALRANRRETIAHLDGLGQSIFYEMFGSPHMPFPPYKSIPLLDFAKLKSGGTPARDNTTYWDGEVPWFSPKDIKQDVLVDSIEHISQAALDGTAIELLPERTVIFVVRGMILAHTFPVAITDVAGTINQDMKAVIPLPGRDFAPEFLAANLNGQCHRVLENAETSAHGTKRLGPQSMRDMLVIDAPLQRQQEFAKRVAEVENLKSKHRAQLAELDNLFLSLQDRAFKGELG